MCTCVRTRCTPPRRERGYFRQHVRRTDDSLFGLAGCLCPHTTSQSHAHEGTSTHTHTHSSRLQANTFLCETMLLLLKLLQWLAFDSATITNTKHNAPTTKIPSVYDTHTHHIRVCVSKVESHRMRHSEQTNVLYGHQGGKTQFNLHYHLSLGHLSFGLCELACASDCELNRSPPSPPPPSKRLRPLLGEFQRPAEHTHTHTL